jgi:uncharacterized protein (DUF1800 family)
MKTHWETYEPTAATPWNLQRVVHLHRRASFAAPWKTLQRDLADGPRPSIDRLLAGNQNTEVITEGFESLADTIADSASGSDSPARLKAWWLYRMLMSPDPLGERLTLMWHNHFATSNRKVQNLVFMKEQNERFRQHARGPFDQLLEAVIKHPAMLIWLDADSNRSGRPNENLARELLELFTLGVGNFSESDVKEAARALTGWAIHEGQFQFKPARHDSAIKTLFGKQAKMNGDDLIRHVVEHPCTAQRLTWRICHTFLSPEVLDEPSLSELAEGLHSRKLDIGWAVETVLRSQKFFAEENLRTRVLGPVEYIVGAIRSLELCGSPPSTLTLAEWTSRLGQDLFYPPNVGGWTEGRSWLTSRSIIARANFATALIEGRLWRPERRPDWSALLERHATGDRLEEATKWLAQLLWGIAPQDGLRDVLRAIDSAKAERSLDLAVALLLARPEHHLS